MTGSNPKLGTYVVSVGIDFNFDYIGTQSLKRESGHSAKVPTDAVGRLGYQGFLPLLI